MDNNILHAVMMQESGGNRNAVSPKNARGLYQVMPATGRNPGFGIKQLQNDSDEEQRRFANDYLDTMLKRYDGNLNLALAAYNAGPGNVDKYGGVPPFKETQNYVKKIIGSLNPIGTAEASEEPYKPTYKEWKSAKLAQQKPIETEQKPTYKEWKAEKLAGQPGILDRAAKNLPGDIKNIGEGVINTIAHPIDALNTLSGLPMGAAANMLPDNWATEIPQQDKDNAANLGRSIVEGVKHPLETFANKPASTILNTMGLLSAGGSLVKGTIGKSAKIAEAKDIANVAKKNSLMKPTYDVLEEGNKKGFVIPQSAVAPSFINNRLEGFAGKAAMNQQSQLTNQLASTAQARKALKLADDKPITGSAIKQAIADNYKPYEDVANMPVPPHLANGYTFGQGAIMDGSKKLLAELKQARHDSKAYYRTAEIQGGNPEMIAKAKSLADRAKIIENEFNARAIANNQPNLVKEMQEARKNIAIIHDVDDARNVATGAIDPAVIGKKLDKSPDRMTGELKQVGEYQQAFEKYAKRGENVQTPGVSKIEATTAVMGGFGGHAVGGGIGAVIGSMLPLVSEPVRNMLLSPWYQKRLMKLMKKNPSKLKKFVSSATNKTINEKALLGLVASDKSDNTIIDKMAQGKNQ